jgi:hypothetical protein
VTQSMTRFKLGCALLAAILFSAAATAHADPGDDRWVPSWTTAFLLFHYEGNGTIDSSVGFSDKGSQDKTVATFLLGLDLKSPALEGVLWEPHVALFAGIQAGPSQKLKLSGQGTLLPIQPEFELGRDPDLPNASDYPGQGSEIDGKYESLGWYLGAGIVFDLPTTPDIRIRPFVMYSGEQVKMEGTVVAVTGTPNNYVVQRDSAKDDDVFHYIGPGLEVEAVLTSNENLGLSLFATVDFLWNVGNDTVHFSDSIANYRYEADDFKPRGGIGLRLSWLSAF